MDLFSLLLCQSLNSEIKMSKGTRGACSRPRKVGGRDNQQEEQGFLKFYWKNEVELQSLNIAARYPTKVANVQH